MAGFSPGDGAGVWQQCNESPSMVSTIDASVASAMLNTISKPVDNPPKPSKEEEKTPRAGWRPMLEIHIFNPPAETEQDKVRREAKRKKIAGSANCSPAPSPPPSPPASPPASPPSSPPLSPRKRTTTDDYNMLSLIGSGAFSKVALVEQIATGKRYAMKVMEKKFLAEVTHNTH